MCPAGFSCGPFIPISLPYLLAAFALQILAGSGVIQLALPKMLGAMHFGRNVFCGSYCPSWPWRKRPCHFCGYIGGRAGPRWIFALRDAFIRLSAIRTRSVLAGAVNSPLERASAGTGLLLGLHSVLRAKGRAVAAAGPIAGYRAPCLPALGKPTHGTAPGQY